MTATRFGLKPPPAPAGAIANDKIPLNCAASRFAIIPLWALASPVGQRAVLLGNSGGEINSRPAFYTQGTKRWLDELFSSSVPELRS